jgi:hypothetical protein
MLLCAPIDSQASQHGWRRGLGGMKITNFSGVSSGSLSGNIPPDFLD